MTTTKTLIVPTSIPHNYEADAYPEFQAFLDQAPVGCIVKCQENGLYRMERTPEIKKPLVVDMNGASWKQTVREPYGINPPVDSQPWVNNRRRSNVRAVGAWHGGGIFNGTLIGCNPYLWTDDRAFNARFEGQHALDIQGPQDFEFGNMRFEKQYGDFVYIAIGAGGQQPSDIYGHDFVGDGNGRQGISVIQGSDMRFEGYELKHIRRAVYDLELLYDTDVVERIVFGGPGLDDVIIGAHVLNFMSSADSTNGHVGAVTVRGHQFSSGPSAVMQMTLTGGDASHKRGPYTIIDNASPNPFGTPLGGLIRMQYVNGAEVHRNVHPLKTGGTWPDGNTMYGVKHSDSVNIDVSGNTFAGGLEVFPIP